MMRRTALLAVASLTMAIVQASPAAASTTGTVLFHCTWQAPAWPSPGDDGRCGAGVGPGTAVVSVSGTDTIGVAYTLAGQGDFAMEFTYANACIANLPPLLWNAAGVITVRNVPAVWGGALTTADVTANFVMNGFGGGFTFVTTGHRVDFAIGATATGSQGHGHAVTTFVPTVSNVCPVGGPISGAVDGQWDLVI